MRRIFERNIFLPQKPAQKIPAIERFEIGQKLLHERNLFFKISNCFLFFVAVAVFSSHHYTQKSHFLRTAFCDIFAILPPEKKQKSNRRNDDEKNFPKLHNNELECDSFENEKSKNCVARDEQNQPNHDINNNFFRARNFFFITPRNK